MFGLSKKTSFIFLGALAVLIGVTVFFMQQQTNINQQATQLTPTPTAVPVPTGITACEVKEAICRWDPLNNTTQYDVEITEVGSGTVIKQSLINHPTTELAFPAEPGKQYQCDVTAKNSCGDGEMATGGGSCPGETPTMTPPDATITPTQPDTTVTPGPSNTPVPSDQPTPSTGLIGSPSPTGSGPTATNSPHSPTPTPLEKLPPTGLGDNIVGLTIVGSALAILGTFVFVFRW